MPDWDPPTPEEQREALKECYKEFWREFPGSMRAGLPGNWPGPPISNRKNK